MKKVLKYLSIPCFLSLILAGNYIKSNTKINVNATDVTVSISGHNLSLQSNINIVYYVSHTTSDEYASCDDCGVLVWDAPQASYEYDENHLATKGEISTISGKKYETFYFDNIAAKQMTNYFYAVAYVKVGDAYTYSDVDRYSILDYCYNKKNNAGTSTELLNVINSTLAYGASAQTYFGYNTDRLANADYYKVTLDNATFKDGFSTYLLTGGSYTISDIIDNPYKNDYYFDGWYTDSGYTTKVTSFDPSTNNTLYAHSIAGTTGLKYSGSAVSDCEDTSVTSVVIPDYTSSGKLVTSIGNSAFYLCKSLSGITIPNSVTSIGSSAFKNCEALSSITIPNSVTSIGANAFTYTTNLTEIVIPSSVTSIGEKAFWGYASDAIKTIYCEATSKPVGWDANWNLKITISDVNTYNDVYYYSETQPTSGNYWHYVNGVPTKWTYSAYRVFITDLSYGHSIFVYLPRLFGYDSGSDGFSSGPFLFYDAVLLVRYLIDTPLRVSAWQNVGIFSSGISRYPTNL